MGIKNNQKGGDSMRTFASALFAVLFAACSAHAVAEHGSKTEAVAMVKRTQEMFKKDGAQDTFKAVDDKSNKSFHDRDLYVFIYNLSGVCVAHGARPALIGRKLIDLKDQNGNFMIREMIKIAKMDRSGWVDYKWPSPISNKIEDKSAYIEKMGKNYFVGVGIYK